MRKSNKALKEQLEKKEEQAKETKVIQETLERHISDKENEFEEHLNLAKNMIKRLEEKNIVLKKSLEEIKENNELLTK